MYGFAGQVADGACEQAVALADPADAPGFRDSRGLARALTGDVPGAITDFQEFVDQRWGPEADRRVLWIRELEKGESPTKLFDSAMLICLLSDICDAPKVESESSGGAHFFQ